MRHLREYIFTRAPGQYPDGFDDLASELERMVGTERGFYADHILAKPVILGHGGDLFSSAAMLARRGYC